MTHGPNITADAVDGVAPPVLDALEPADAAGPIHPAFDIDDIPFSYRGSWLNLSPVVGLHRRSEDVHLVSHRTDLTAVLGTGLKTPALNYTGPTFADELRLNLSIPPTPIASTGSDATCRTK